MKRIFIAIALPASVKRTLRGITGLLRAGLPDSRELRFVPPENMHMTVMFIGSVNEDSIAQVLRVLKDATTVSEQFFLTGSEIVCMPEPAPRMIWCRFPGQNGYGNLVKRIITGIKVLRLPSIPRNVFRRAHQDPVPHITLLRSRHIPHALGNVVVSTRFPKVEFTASSCSLFVSHPARSGATYEEIKQFSLRTSRPFSEMR